MGTFYSKNDYRNYLAHYGVKNMKRPHGLKYKTKKKSTNPLDKEPDSPFRERPNRRNPVERAEEWLVSNNKPDLNQRRKPPEDKPSSLSPDAQAHRRDVARRMEQERVHNMLESIARRNERMRSTAQRNQRLQRQAESSARHKKPLANQHHQDLMARRRLAMSNSLASNFYSNSRRSGNMPELISRRSSSGVPGLIGRRRRRRSTIDRLLGS